MASRPQPIPLQDHALDNLRFIRATMERAGSFTAVPGTGGVIMGLSAFAAAMSVMAYPQSFLSIWLTEAVVALAIGLGSMIHKARGLRIALDSGPARKFTLAFAPPLIVGAVLTDGRPARWDRSFTPWTLALYVRRRHHGRGRIFRSHYSFHGCGFSLRWCGRAVLAAGMGQYLAGGCIRRTTRNLRSRLSRGGTVAKSSTASKTPPAVVGTAAKETAGLDRLIHERLRLGIVSALAANDSSLFRS